MRKKITPQIYKYVSTSRKAAVFILASLNLVLLDYSNLSLRLYIGYKEPEKDSKQWQMCSLCHVFIRLLGIMVHERQVTFGKSLGASKWASEQEVLRLKKRGRAGFK